MTRESGKTETETGRQLSRAQLLALRAAAAGRLHLGTDGRLHVDADAGRITLASVRACQRRGLLDQRNPLTGYFPVTDAGREVLR